jgi:hypothetical protein
MPNAANPVGVSRRPQRKIALRSLAPDNIAASEIPTIAGSE